MKYLIVGLGNIGAEYEGTRHNIGFDIVDRLIADKDELVFKPDRYASMAKTKYRGRSLVVIKPATYMNLSGKAVKYWMEKENIPIEKVLIIVDDIALDLGLIRLRSKGSAGGHNGLENIIQSLQTSQFNRLRFGIGKDFQRGYQVDFVLGKWNEEEKKILQKQIPLAVDAIRSFCFIGAAKTATLFNNKQITS
jgi:PTH1 family peptidyl-tRNA hydrolase